MTDETCVMSHDRHNISHVMTIMTIKTFLPFSFTDLCHVHTWYVTWHVTWHVHVTWYTLNMTWHVNSRIPFCLLVQSIKSFLILIYSTSLYSSGSETCLAWNWMTCYMTGMSLCDINIYMTCDTTCLKLKIMMW